MMDDEEKFMWMDVCRIFLPFSISSNARGVGLESVDKHKSFQ